MFHVGPDFLISFLLQIALEHVSIEHLFKMSIPIWEVFLDMFDGRSVNCITNILNSCAYWVVSINRKSLLWSTYLNTWSFITWKPSFKARQNMTRIFHLMRAFLSLMSLIFLTLHTAERTGVLAADDAVLNGFVDVFLHVGV